MIHRSELDAPLANVFSRGRGGCVAIIHQTRCVRSTLDARGRNRIVLSKAASLNFAKFRGLSKATTLTFNFPCGRTPGACVHGLALTPSIATFRLLGGKRDVSLA